MIAQRWTKPALADLDEACAWTAPNFSPAVAERLAARIVLATEDLRTFPDMGRRGRVDGTRELIIGRTPYFIVYRLADERVEVIALIHGARAWPVR